MSLFIISIEKRRASIEINHDTLCIEECDMKYSNKKINENFIKVFLLERMPIAF